MSVVQEGAFDEEGEGNEGSPELKKMTALSILESLGTQADEGTSDGPGVDAESSESSADGGERLTIEDDVFGLEGLEVSLGHIYSPAFPNDADLVLITLTISLIVFRTRE